MTIINQKPMGYQISGKPQGRYRIQGTASEKPNSTEFTVGSLTCIAHNGSLYHAVDTDKWYQLHEGTWYEVKVAGGGGGDSETVNVTGEDPYYTNEEEETAVFPT